MERLDNVLAKRQALREAREKGVQPRPGPGIV